MLKTKVSSTAEKSLKRGIDALKKIPRQIIHEARFNKFMPMSPADRLHQTGFRKTAYSFATFYELNGNRPACTVF